MYASWLLTQLHGVGLVSPDGWTSAQCPAHDDRNPSLSFKTDGDGQVVAVKCHAGCTLAQIAAGLAVEPDAFKRRRRRPTIVATYDYTDEVGALQYQVVRLEPKSFRMRRPIGQGHWSWKVGDARRVLYRLTELASQPRVYLVEGEKDTDALAALGLVATTNPNGAGHWADPYTEQLRAAGVGEVAIVPDNDEPGEAHAGAVARSCLAKGLPAKIVRPPDLPPKGDVSDWLALGHSADDLEALADQAPAVTLSEVTTDAGADDERRANVNAIISTLRSLATDERLPKFDTVLEAIARLTRTVEREHFLAQLKDLFPGVTWKTLTAELATVQTRLGLAKDGGEQGRAVVLTDPELWPESVDGARLLDEFAQTDETYVVLPARAADAMALWKLLTYSHDAFDVLPLLVFASPEKRCGKTIALSLLCGLASRALAASNISPAALFRTIEAYRPTLAVDEADTFLKTSDELRGVLNSGHTRGTAFVIRVAGDDHEPRQFSTWGPKALALIGRLPDTLEDRAIVVPMRRRLRTERVKRFRFKYLADFEPLRRQAARWAADNLEALRTSDPAVPESLHDRAADNWRPLLAIADLVGGPWPERARQAALVLSGVAQEVSDESPGVLLLADLRDLWQQHGHAKSVTTAELVSALHRRDDRPWKEWYRGQPITNRGIAKLLGRYGIGPTQLPKPDNRKGYVFADFSEAWARYLPPEDPNPLKPACENNNLGSVSRPKPVGTVSDLEWKVSSEIYGQVSDVSANGVKSASLAFITIAMDPAIAPRSPVRIPIGPRALPSVAFRPDLLGWPISNHARPQRQPMRLPPAEDHA